MGYFLMTWEEWYHLKFRLMLVLPLEPIWKNFFGTNWNQEGIANITPKTSHSWNACWRIKLNVSDQENRLANVFQRIITKLSSNFFQYHHGMFAQMMKNMHVALMKCFHATSTKWLLKDVHFLVKKKYTKAKICLTGDTICRIDIVSRCFENKNKNCCETKHCKNSICLSFTNLHIHDLATLMPGRPSHWVARYGFVNL